MLKDVLLHFTISLISLPLMVTFRPNNNPHRVDDRTKHTETLFAFTLFVVIYLKLPSHCMLKYENIEAFLLHHARAPISAFNRSISMVKSGRKLIATQAETNRHRALLLLLSFFYLCLVAAWSLLTWCWLFFLRDCSSWHTDCFVAQ